MKKFRAAVDDHNDHEAKTTAIITETLCNRINVVCPKVCNTPTYAHMYDFLFPIFPDFFCPAI